MTRATSARSGGRWARAVVVVALGLVGGCGGRDRDERAPEATPTESAASVGTADVAETKTAAAAKPSVPSGWIPPVPSRPSSQSGTQPKAAGVRPGMPLRPPLDPDEPSGADGSEPGSLAPVPVASPVTVAPPTTPPGAATTPPRSPASSTPTTPSSTGSPPTPPPSPPPAVIPDVAGPWHAHAQEDVRGAERTLESYGVGSGLVWEVDLAQAGGSIAGRWRDLGDHPQEGGLELGQVRPDGTIAFVKRYRPDYGVRYEGWLDPATGEVRGRWHSQPAQFEGKFVMRRGRAPEPAPIELGGPWSIHSRETSRGAERTLESRGAGSGLEWRVDLTHAGAAFHGTWQDLGAHPASGAIKAGRVAGTTIQFHKRYRADYVVQYSGTYDRTTGDVRGTWTVPGRFHGDFVMTRDLPGGGGVPGN